MQSLDELFPPLSAATSSASNVYGLADLSGAAAAASATFPLLMVPTSHSNATAMSDMATPASAPQTAGMHPAMSLPRQQSPDVSHMSAMPSGGASADVLDAWSALGLGAPAPGASITDLSPPMWTSQPSTSRDAFTRNYLSQLLQPVTVNTLVSYEMFIKVAYRGSAMAAMRVTHQDGCRLFYGQPPQRNALDPETQERLFGPRRALHLSLPLPRTSQSILPSMWMLLENTHRGLVLQMEENDIYATRLCPASVYYAKQDTGAVVPLERCKRTRIFSYEHFKQKYEYYKSLPSPEGRLMAAEAPCYEVLMSIGQHWGPERHRDNNLISINITHSLGEKVIESFRQECFKQRAPFDTDFMSVDTLDDDDKRAKVVMAAAIQGQIQKAVGATSAKAPSAAAAAVAKPAAKTAKNMRKTKEKKRPTPKQATKPRMVAVTVGN